MARCTRCGADIDSAAWCSSCGLMQVTAPVDPAAGTSWDPSITGPTAEQAWQNALALAVLIAAAGALLLFVDSFDEAVFSAWQAFEDASTTIAHPLDWFYFGPAVVFALLAGIPLGLFFGAARRDPSKIVFGPLGAFLSWPVLLVVHDIVHELKWGLDNDDLGDTFSYLLWEPSYIYAPVLTVAITVVTASITRSGDGTVASSSVP